MELRVRTQDEGAPPRVAVVGSSGVGLTMRSRRFPEPGETVTDGLFSQGPGGKGSNQAIAARRLGATVDFLTIVGPDAFGDELRTLWDAEGVAYEAAGIGVKPTMIGFIMVDENGENRIVIAPGALDEFTADAVFAFRQRIAACDVLLTNLEIPALAAAAALRCAKLEAVRTVLNPAPATTLPADVRPTIDHLTPNRVEAATLTGLSPDSSVDKLLDGLRRLFDSVIVLTLGAGGVAVDAGGRREQVDAVPVDRVVDTTGAGDAFSAAYAVALAEGATAIEAARFAAFAGAFATTRAEAVPGLPRRQELLACVQSGRIGHKAVK